MPVKTKDTKEYKPISSQVRDMFSSIAHKYDITNFALSFGTHLIWKTQFISKIPLQNPVKIMDLACGTGDLVPKLKKRFKSAQVLGVDFCEPMLDVARKRFPDFEFATGDALNLGYADDQFDLVTISFGVRNFEHLTHGLKEIHRILKPGGVIAVLEFGQPSNKVFRMLYEFYSKYIMPIIGGVLTGNKEAYKYLPETAKNFPCKNNFLDNLKSVGFSECSYMYHTFGIAYSYYGKK
jgi:demethylmenaquinone methyltransferase/2-methoxy-6-polyprenyl-1,4-benzoquinol methylase